MPRRLRKTAQFVADTLPDLKNQKVEKVLDLGCGAGRHCVLLANNGFEVIGIDISKNALSMAKQYAQREKLENVTLIRAAMTNIPLTNCHLDATISVSVIHHALKKDITTTINEIHRVLRKNGWFLANLASVKDPRYGSGQRIESNTYQILEAFEEKHFEELHHFFTKREALRLLTHFSKKDVKRLKNKPNYWKILAVK